MQVQSVHSDIHKHTGWHAQDTCRRVGSMQFGLCTLLTLRDAHAPGDSMGRPPLGVDALLFNLMRFNSGFFDHFLFCFAFLQEPE